MAGKSRKEKGWQIGQVQSRDDVTHRPAGSAASRGGIDTAAHSR
ncbi:hypothetical protein [Streptomyces nigrescens]|nr:hypothetical protein [Streptomyces nigrescens]